MMGRIVCDTWIRVPRIGGLDIAVNIVLRDHRS